MGTAIDFKDAEPAMVTGIPAGQAGRTICVDFDGTIFPWGPLGDDADPITGAVESVNKLFNQGYYVVIYSSRLSPRWHAEMGWSLKEARLWQAEHITRRLDKHGILFHEVTAEKIPARWYIDDRAIEFRGDWEEVMRKVL